MKKSVYADSKEYTCQVIKLPPKQIINGFDNLVKVTVQGKTCLISKDSDPDVLYLFFQSGTVLDPNFLKQNNLYRHSDKNLSSDKKGFFEDSGRVKAIKFKGVISDGFLIELNSLEYLLDNFKILELNVGDEFNSLDTTNICKKYIIKEQRERESKDRSRNKFWDTFIDGNHAPRHMDTAQLFKSLSKDSVDINLDTTVAITYKLHGTSARYYNALSNRKLSRFERLLRRLGVNVNEKDYNFVSASRNVIKSVGNYSNSNANHYYAEDHYSKLGRKIFKDVLNKGEAVYCEIIGSWDVNEPIQGGYTYKLNSPEVYIYRISNINDSGIEIDLSYPQMLERAKELGVKVCPQLFYGSLRDFMTPIYDLRKIVSWKQTSLSEGLEDIFYNQLLGKPSILDSSVVEEGFCLRIDSYPKPNIYKIKSKEFLLKETNWTDKGIEISG